MTRIQGGDEVCHFQRYDLSLVLFAHQSFGRACFGVEGHEEKSRVNPWRHSNISVTCQQTRRVDEHAVVLRRQLIVDTETETVKETVE